MGAKKETAPARAGLSSSIMDTKIWELIGLAAGVIASIGVALYVFNAFPRWCIERPQPVRSRTAAPGVSTNPAGNR